MSMKTKLTAFMFLILSISAFAESEVKTIILKDNSIIQAEDIFSISYEVDTSSLYSIELNDQTLIQSNEIKKIIFKKIHTPHKFQHEIQSSRAVVGNGNGSGG